MLSELLLRSIVSVFVKQTPETKVCYSPRRGVLYGEIKIQLGPPSGDSRGVTRIFEKIHLIFPN